MLNKWFSLVAQLAVGGLISTHENFFLIIFVHCFESRLLQCNKHVLYLQNMYEIFYEDSDFHSTYKLYIKSSASVHAKLPAACELGHRVCQLF